MRAFRHQTTLGFVALLAFALQAMLAFAHTHTHTDAAVGTRELATRAVSYGMCRPDAERSCPAPARHDDSSCPLCWATSLAGWAILGAPPVVEFPAVGVRKALPERAVAQLSGSSSVQFNARAPPHDALV